MITPTNQNISHASSSSTSLSSLSAESFFKKRNAENEKEDSKTESKAYTINISDAGRQALGRTQGAPNSSSSENNSGSFTFASAQNYDADNSNTAKRTGNTNSVKGQKNPNDVDKTENTQNAMNAGTLASGATVNVYTEKYADGDKKIPGTSEKTMAEITHKNGTVETIALTANTVISEDASGQLIVKEVPKTQEAVGMNPDGSPIMKDAPMHLQGTDGDDVIINIFEGTESIQGGTGNDTVISFHDVASIDLGEGNNVLQAMGGNYANVVAGNGNNLIDATKANSYFESISFGDGNNRASIDSAATINMGDGANIINAALVSNELNVGSGNNNIDIKSLTGKINTGSGNNNIDISSMLADSEVSLGTGNNNVDVTNMLEGSRITSNSPEAEAGTQEVNARNMTGADINLGSGNNTVSVDKMENSSLKTGNGDNELSVKEMNNSQLDTGDGDSRINIETMFKSSLNAGTGNNAFYMDSLSESTINIKKNEKDDPERGKNSFNIKDEMKNSEIYAGDGDSKFNISTMDESVISSGKGNDSFNFDDIGSGNINTGEGNDIINVKGSIWGHENASPLNVEMGEGENKLNVGGHAHKLQFNSKGENDSVTIGSFLSESSINTGFGEDKVNLNPSSFVYKSEVSFGINEEEQAKTHEISEKDTDNIQSKLLFQNANPEANKILEETLKKSPFYTPSPMRDIYGV